MAGNHNIHNQDLNLAGDYTLPNSTYSPEYSAMKRLLDKVKHEMRELIPVTIFFFISFQLLALTQALMLKEYGIHVTIFFEALIGALIVAKVVVITDHFTFVNRFPEKPLIYNVAWKTLIYVSASIAVRYSEHLFHAWRETGNFTAANHLIVEKTIWPHFWVVQLWLLILFLIYCAFRELVRVLGRDRVVRMFFHPPTENLNHGQ